MKKLYNPFKMWGSYIGAISFFFIPVTRMYIGALMSYLILGNAYGIMYGTTKPIQSISIYLIFTVFPVGFGFLIGWGIHSFIRRLRR